MIEGRQRDQGHRRSAEHGLEYGDEKLRIAKLHATMTINGLQRKNRVATAERGK